MRLPDYSTITVALGITRCRGIDPRYGTRCGYDHDRGVYAEGMVHWSDRHPTRAGIRRFLLLAAQPTTEGKPVWARPYLAHRYADSAARMIRVRLPSELSILDRRRVRRMIVAANATGALRDEAMAWASR